MADFSYKKDIKVAMKIKGILNTDGMNVVIDDEIKSLSTLLSDFDDQLVTIGISTSESEELEEPIEE